LAERDGGLTEWEQRWRERLTLFGENEELLTAWNGGTMEADVVVGAVAAW